MSQTTFYFFILIRDIAKCFAKVNLEVQWWNLLSPIFKKMWSKQEILITHQHHPQYHQPPDHFPFILNVHNPHTWFWRRAFLFIVFLRPLSWNFMLFVFWRGCYCFLFVFSYLYFSGSSFDKYSRKLMLHFWVKPVLWDIIWMFQKVKAAMLLSLCPNLSLEVISYTLIKSHLFSSILFQN